MPTRINNIRIYYMTSRFNTCNIRINKLFTKNTKLTKIEVSYNIWGFWTKSTPGFFNRKPCLWFRDFLGQYKMSQFRLRLEKLGQSTQKKPIIILFIITSSAGGKLNEWGAGAEWCMN